MRHLIELLNSLAGSAAKLPSSPAASTGAGAAGLTAGCLTRARSSSSERGEARVGGSLPQPMSAAAAAALPALHAAEAALEAKLANDAAACTAEFEQLQLLMSRLARERGFTDAEACRDLNRYCDVLPYDSNRVHLGACAAAGSGTTASAINSGSSSSSGTSSRAASGALASPEAPGPSGLAAAIAEAAAAAAGTGERLAAAAPTDYINASPLAPSSPDDVPWSYIAAQGPLKHTREAFWQMVVERQCSAVIMLTRTVERGIHKCSSYFATAPRSAKAFGRYAVSTLSVEQVAPDLERRCLVIKDVPAPGSGALKRPLDSGPQQQQQPAAERVQGQPAARAAVGGGGGGGGKGKHPTVQHYQYDAWPDHGVPSSPDPLLRLCQELRESGAHAAPIVVHCSAGIGRSGVFCVLDIITRRLLRLAEGPPAAVAPAEAGAPAVDVAGLVADLRRQRLGMVQTRDQFVFCHAALLHFVRTLAAERHAV